MCLSTILTVIRVDRTTAIMSDGRKVSTGLLKSVKTGDRLEVLVDLALGKVSQSDLKDINSARKQVFNGGKL
jgi:hypothetical protein